ncbi:saccharopine dehydrogenase NADP-binding domain-containing protein [bacterium AH-315-K03]|nr:saccharopine dehydrogenase NADP-binding domain-containing protein [bacterium AH-315-K03]
MKEILLLGAGKIGVIIAQLLSSSGDYRVSVADKDQKSLDRLPQHPNILPLSVDVNNADQLHLAMQGKFAALSACPFHTVPQDYLSPGL